MPTVAFDAVLQGDVLERWEQLAKQWDCSIEEAIERAAIEMINQLPPPTFEKDGNIVFLEQAQ